MTSDSPAAIKGDVIPERTQRISGNPGENDGLIELALVGHDHRYQVHIEMGGGAPRLMELRVIPDSDNAEIDPVTIRQVPVRRLAKAAARFISLTEHGVAVAGDFDNPTDLLQPDREPPGRRKLDDVHYREVAYLLLAAREMGLPPREYVGDQLHGTIPTVDRWIKESKRRGFLPRNWATTVLSAVPANDEEPHS